MVYVFAISAKTFSKTAIIKECRFAKSFLSIIYICNQNKTTKMKTYRVYFDKLIELLIEETEYTREELMTSKCEDCVNARLVIVAIMAEVGITDRNIAKLTGFTPSMISRDRMIFADRYSQNQTIRILTKIVRTYAIKCIAQFNAEHGEDVA